MKNLMKSVLIAASVCVLVNPASAIETTSIAQIMAQDTIVKDTVRKEVAPMSIYLAQAEVTFTQIEVSS